MRHGLGPLQAEIVLAGVFNDEYGYEYEDMEDHPYNIMGAEPGQRYGS